MAMEDHERLSQKIKRLTLKKDDLTARITFYEDTLAANEKAQAFLQSLSYEELDKFRDPAYWQTCPETSYIYNMRGMF